MTTRKEILEQLSRGEITASQAAEMLDKPADAVRAKSTERPAPAPATAPPATKAKKSGRRWLRIHVSDLETGRNHVRVNVPLGLVQLGMKVGARFTDELDSEVMQDVIDALEDTEISGTLVEVEDVDDNERVHIFVD